MVYKCIIDFNLNNYTNMFFLSFNSSPILKNSQIPIPMNNIFLTKDPLLFTTIYSNLVFEGSLLDQCNNKKIESIKRFFH